MQLGAMGSIRFTEITHTPRVQQRIALVRAALRNHGGPNPVLSATHFAVRKIAEEIYEEDRLKPAVYLAFGGDISTIMMATGSRTFFCFDMIPFFNDRLSGKFNLRHVFGAYPYFGEFPDHLLVSAAMKKQQEGFLNNGFVHKFEEIGAFMFFELLGLEASDLRVFAAEGSDEIFSITFNMNQQKYQVYFAQEKLFAGKMPEILKNVPVGSVLLKGGKAPMSEESYEMLDSTAGEFPDNALIICDKELTNSNLRTVPFSFGRRWEWAPFGYADGLAYLYRVRG